MTDMISDAYYSVIASTY